MKEHNGIKVRKKFEVIYEDNGKTKVEYFDDINIYGEGIFVKKINWWGYLVPKKGIIIPFGYQMLCHIEGIKRNGEELLLCKANGKFGCITIEGKKVVTCKYNFVEPKYYEETGGLVVENTGGLKGVVKDCKEIVILNYHKVNFNFSSKLWECEFKGLDTDYYTINGEKID